jgi:hypothetical protein
LYLNPPAASVTTVIFYKSRREKIELKDVSSTHDLREFLFFGQFTGREKSELKAWVELTPLARLFVKISFLLGRPCKYYWVLGK